MQIKHFDISAIQIKNPSRSPKIEAKQYNAIVMISAVPLDYPFMLSIE